MPALKKIIFGMYTPKEIHALSVVEIKTSLCFNVMDHPIKDGLYDLCMGPSGNMKDLCGTCKQTTRHCPGHPGHIDLPLPVVNPLFHKEIFMLLRVSCGYCFKLLIPAELKNLIIYQLKLLDQGRITEAEELSTIVSLGENAREKQATSEEDRNNLVKDKIIEYVKGMELDLVHVPPTRSTESLRRQFINIFLKQIVTPKNCPFCKKPYKRIISFQNKLTSMSKVEVADKFKDSGGGESAKKVEAKYITPSESKEMLRKIWSDGEDLIKEFFPILKNTDMEYPTDLFYMDTILVTPPKARPVNFVNNEIIENCQTRAYKNVVNDCMIIKHLIKAVQNNGYDEASVEIKNVINVIKGSTLLEKVQQSWLQLQCNIDCLLDTDLNKLSSTKGILGLKQIVEKKEGIIRMHMMGKRVNYAARSVITPDPNLQVQEIGVPEEFAKKLTYPVTVNYFNVEELREMVRNGPDVYPGANLVENENGSQIRLFGGEENRVKREGIAKLLMKSVETGNSLNSSRKKVHRHLLNGDILLLNRQPTLHRPSIMAHKARILKNEKTLRMHYSNCKSYNADFDGDEMNAHFPQSDLARSEAYNILNVSNNYLVPKDGTPLGGLIQDHIVSAVRLTVRGQMFEKDDYQQLVYQGLCHKRGNIKLLPPCMLKPKKLWSGKQIISTILINIIPEGKKFISFNGVAKINFKAWEKESSRPWKCGVEFENPSQMSEFEVIIRNGNLLSGVLDKQHFGATPYGLTHCLYELYGGECSSSFLNSVGRLCTAYLQLHGFTLGVEDILVKKEADKSRTQIIEKLRKIGDEATMKALDLEEIPSDLIEIVEKEYFKDRLRFRAKLDQTYKKMLDIYTNEINKVCLPQGLISKFPENNLQLMVTSGAKGSTVNTMQISCLLGQIELEGKRPPWMISGKSLPCFKVFETLPQAGGFVDSRFMTGITPSEFFFHCMAGREGLIDTAVKTSRSGYLQRCLVKNLEGLSVYYDGTVRDHDGSVVQFAYGEDGLEVQKSKFFEKNCMDFLNLNQESIVDGSVIKRLKDSTDYKAVEKYKRKVADWTGSETKTSGFTLFSYYAKDRISEKHFRKFNKSTGRSKAYSKILKKWNALSEEEKNNYRSKPKPDPVVSKFYRNSDFGVITEKIDKLIQDYINEKSVTNKNESKKIKSVFQAKYMMSLCQPGEPVGLLAAQSVGEPSTQMTLNTFHFAGRGEMNVTLGIPRLREILMTASKFIKTPYIEVPLKPKSEKRMAKNGGKLKKNFQRVTLSDVLEKIVVNEKLLTKPSRLFTYTLKFKFLPYSCYKKDFAVTPAAILAYMEKPFLISLCRVIREFGNKYGDIIQVTKAEREMNKPDEEENQVDDIDAAGAAIMKMKSTGEDHESSDEDEELDDDDATKAKLRNRHKENQEYDEPEESEEEKSEDEEKENDENVEVEKEADEEEVELNLTEAELKNVESRKSMVTSTFAMVKNYKYDVAKEEWCEMVIGIPLTLSRIDISTVLRKICEKSVLYEIPGIKRAIIDKKMTGELTLKTEGVNMIEIFKFKKLLNLNKLYSNDIHQVVETYGIEAGARVIVKELKDVFEVYGIKVDPRHLLLIADYMTHQGYFSPFNRTGMMDNASPLQQISFESSTRFLKTALVLGKEDYLQSPSARIMAGKFCKTGTGCFDVSYIPQIK